MYRSMEIYIPICFYFNSSLERKGDAINRFTFQYVSILMPQGLLFVTSVVLFTFQYVSILILYPTNYHSQCYTFTFQYVSILISCRFELFAVKSNLHSNMFLF